MRQLLSLTLAALIAVTSVACVRQVEGSGRTQVAFYSDAQMNQMGEQAYTQILAEEQPCTNKEAIDLVNRVGRRLAAVAPNRGFTYEFTVLESATPNAFCLPGGKVAVYTGILPLCQNEAGLAAVLGHEIAHAIADHGNERMSQGVLVQGGQVLLAELLQQKGVSDSTINLTMAACGIGAQLGIMLPFSRSHESEADRLGLDYMARAGYDPKEAVGFWQRFAALDAGGQPSWLSTHPASAERAAALNAQMASAQALYDAAPEKHGSGALVPQAYRAAPAAK